jgi:hypothetical protein
LNNFGNGSIAANCNGSLFAARTGTLHGTLDGVTDGSGVDYRFLVN